MATPPIREMLDSAPETTTASSISSSATKPLPGVWRAGTIPGPPPHALHAAGQQSGDHGGDARPAARDTSMGRDKPEGISGRATSTAPSATSATDPTRRVDLERLLAGFPSLGSPLHMDAQRLRRLLDL